MIKIRIDEDTFLVADFKEELSPAEEEVTAYRLAGNNSGSIAKILGKSVETVRRQLKSSYAKTHVDGLDDPITMLSLKAFKSHWISFAMLLLSIKATCLPDSDDVIRLNPRTAQRTFRDDFLPLAA